MRNESTRWWGLGLLLALSAAACGPALEEPDRAEASTPIEGDADPDRVSPHAVTPERNHPDDATVLVPTSDVNSDDVTGVPDRRRLYRNVDEGKADGSNSYITLERGHRTGDFTVGFSGGPEGPLTEVEVHYTAKRHGSRGRAWVALYDGSRLIGRGRVNTLHSDWRNFKDRFEGLSVARAKDLWVRLFFETTSGHGGLRVTRLWLRVKAKPETPTPFGPRRVDAFLLRDVSTCVIGNACETEPCLALSDSSGTRRVTFANDGAFRAVPPGDPSIPGAEVVQCLHLRLSDAEVAERRAELERYRDDATRWMGGNPTLDLRIHEVETAEMSLTGFNGGLWVAPWDARPVIFPFLTRETDFVLVTPGVRDPELDLHHELPACGLAYGADFGVGGAGYSWIPDTASSFFFQCADHGVYTHEWLHQLHFAVHVLSGFDDLYDGAYPACGMGDPNTRRWFPDTHECVRDPDFPACGGSDCGSNDIVNEHVLTAHWPPWELERLITNHCRNGIQDYDETGVDTGPDCPGTMISPPDIQAPLTPPAPVAKPLPVSP